MNDKKIGTILCELGIISDEQLTEALCYQAVHGGKLGEVLVELEFIENDDIIIGLSEQSYGLDDN
jgi:hypothetical protein